MEEEMFSDFDIAFSIISLVKAMKYIRSLKIIHRHLKTSNYSRIDDGTIKICDSNI